MTDKPKDETANTFNYVVSGKFIGTPARIKISLNGLRQIAEEGLNYVENKTLKLWATKDQVEAEKAPNNVEDLVRGAVNQVIKFIFSPDDGKVPAEAQEKLLEAAVELLMAGVHKGVIAIDRAEKIAQRVYDTGQKKPEDHWFRMEASSLKSRLGLKVRGITHQAANAADPQSHLSHAQESLQPPGHQ